MATEPMHPDAQAKYEESLGKVVNSTGFPLQLGVKRKIEETVVLEHRWDVMRRKRKVSGLHIDRLRSFDISPA